ncbi:MAG: hypothetical protein H6935_08270 [Thiobacillus sp.]|nr:hypothetical protein [Thiobacillus sp.]
MNFITGFFLKLSLLFVLPLAILVLLLGIATSPRPAVARGGDVAVTDLERGRLVWSSLGLRNMAEGQERQVRLSERDLGLGLNYLAGRMEMEGASISVSRERLLVRASQRLPWLDVPRYLNWELALAQDGSKLAPAGLRLGSLPLPAVLAGQVLEWGLALSPVAPQYLVARDMMRAARLGQGYLTLRFVWRGLALEEAMARGAGLDVAILGIYRQRLATLKARDFPVVLGQVFALARERSGKGDPVVENRAALTALAERALGQNLVSVRGLQGLGRMGGVNLAGRGDFAQHFALSAFIAATGGEGLSDAAGLYKELRDAREGSGFSFNDLAADRAGSRLGEAGTRSESQARKVQAVLAGVKEAGVFFPRVDDLPQFMNQAEFERRFGSVGAPAYKAMVEKIEARIAALPLYR